MKELTIFEFQAKTIEDTLRTAANVLKSHGKRTCLDRDIMESWQMIKNVIANQKEKQVSRY